jgi:hypothetical protein
MAANALRRTLPEAFQRKQAIQEKCTDSRKQIEQDFSFSLRKATAGDAA